MRVDGTWQLGDDGVTRPIFWAEVRDSRGDWVEVPFLADCGADRTVLSPIAFAALSFTPVTGEDSMAGIGGRAEAVVFDTRIRIPRSDGAAISFRGEFSAVLDSTALDISLLSRDITNHFALIIDRPGDAVCLLSRGEVYQA